MLTDERAEHHGGPTGREGSHVRGFGELEAAVMERLWRADSPRTVREMHTELTADRPLAYTTVMTVMDKLHRKGWLTREPVGRAYAYTTAISKDRYTADLMGEALATSSNRSAALLAFLDRLTPDEAAQLRAALDEQAANPTPTAEAHSSRRRTR
jgi:predicted transcriptional regulator